MTTKVYLEPSPLVEPFNDSPGDIPIANTALSIWQSKCFEALDLERIDTYAPPCLVIPENCFVTEGALTQFLEGANGRNAVLVLGHSRFARDSTPVQRDVSKVEDGWKFNRIRYVQQEGQSPVDVVVDPDEVKLDLPMNNPYLDQDKIELGIARHAVMQLDHWVHILWVNQIAGGLVALSTPKWLWVLRAVWAILRTFSFNKWKILSAMNVIGKGCDIHPTAVIEGSTLGKNVTVGPYARVLMSHLDDGAVVMAGAQVEFATIGAKSMVSEHSVLRFSVLYPEAVASQYLMQQCVLGRGTVTTGGAFTMDLNFDHEIRVPLDGKLHSTGNTSWRHSGMVHVLAQVFGCLAGGQFQMVTF